eukprot:XP_011668414.1 PREDICTED: acetyl-CoA carboxylase-like [Strongylocentrotus purpuratus]
MYGHQYCPDSLKKLIMSETTIFDVLPDFFFHMNSVVRQAALEVYVRRAYIAYDLNCLQHAMLSNGLCFVEFQFMLPSSHPNRIIKSPRSDGLPRVASIGEELMGGYLPPCQRTGVMCAFSSIGDFEKSFDEVIDRFADMHLNFSHGVDADNNPEHNCEIDEPIHIVNIAIQYKELKSDKDLAEMFLGFCRERKQQLFERDIRRVTFVVFQRREFPKYFTYRARLDFHEDHIYRHLEPALAFQLEINRMSNFDLHLMDRANYRMHLYLGSAKFIQTPPAVRDYHAGSADHIPRPPDLHVNCFVK